MKRKMISIFCVLLAMSLLLCGCAADDESVSGGDVAFELSKDLIDDDIAQLKLFESGCFYISGSMTDASGETLPMEMAIKNGNSNMASQMEGVTIAFMCVDGKYYMNYPDGECVLELDEAVCREMELDPAELTFDASSIAIGDVDNSVLVSEEDALVDTEKAVCRTYQLPNGAYVKTYMKDGKMIRLQREDAQGNMTSVFDIDVLADIFPDSAVNLPSGSKLYSGTTGMMAFMLKFASAVGMDAFE
ncbi:MAG: hypothetical protein IKJ63_09875 [Clostridia bacterium]|nr:hypothetical protein [Clostridia bacterium]MBR3955767.1 hypothetical protein [Clostridia bacterium]